MPTRCSTPTCPSPASSWPSFPPARSWRATGSGSTTWTWRRPAGYLTALGCEVVAHDPFLQPGPGLPPLLALPDLLGRCDVVSLHAPLTARTKGLIGAAELATMKPDAVLINTARGGLVDVD